MNEEKRKITCTTGGITPGFEDAPAPGPLKPNGQHSSYWVLCDAERAKGFIRPVRDSYRHVGIAGPKNPLRDLTTEEHERYDTYGYVKYEEYPKSDSAAVGRFWTAADLAKVNKGCGTTTTMSRSIAETYARDPHYYGSTFCCACGTHLPVGESGEFVWLDGSRVGS
jgi:hypothetical protein